ALLAERQDAIDAARYDVHAGSVATAAREGEPAVDRADSVAEERAVLVPVGHPHARLLRAHPEHRALLRGERGTLAEVGREEPGDPDGVRDLEKVEEPARRVRGQGRVRLPAPVSREIRVLDVVERVEPDDRVA